MRTIIILLSLAALFGCSRKPDARVAEMEKRVVELEAKCASHEARIFDLTGLTSRAVENLQKDVRALNRAHAEQTALALTCVTKYDFPAEVTPIVAAEIARVLEERAQAFRATARPGAAAPAPAPGRPAAEATKDGVPLSVWKQIAASAEKKWPGDFTMQSAEIGWQTEAWLKVNR